MKVLVVSDSHGDVENMCRAVELVRPRMLLHLGDGWRDAEEVARRYPDLPIEKVPGNCDFRRQEPAERLVMLCGKLFLLCHGHTLGVKSGIYGLIDAAVERDCDVALYGHTHMQDLRYISPGAEVKKPLSIVNPGSIRLPRDGYEPKYAIITIAGGKPLISCTRLER